MHYRYPDSTMEPDDFDFGPQPGRWRRRIRILGVTLLGIVALVVVLGAAAFYEYYHGTQGNQSGKLVTFKVRGGDGFSTIATRLYQDKVIRSTLFFDIYTKVNPTFLLLPGLYSLHQDESAAGVLATLKQGPNEFKLTVVPGMTLAQIAQVVGSIPGHSATAFSSALSFSGYKSPFLTTGKHNLEGMLSPDTYFVLPDERNRVLIQEMLNQTTKVAESIGLQPGSKHFGLGPYQILIAASLIQREALVLSDYPKVARVIYNRLAIGMNLQFDSTVLYGLHLSGGSPTLAQLAKLTPYNTYLNPGLPPTPICAPNAVALSAALNPLPGPWLYFVTVQADGIEAFSVTYQQQLANETLAAERGLG